MAEKVSMVAIHDLVQYQTHQVKSKGSASQSLNKFQFGARGADMVTRFLFDCKGIVVQAEFVSPVSSEGAQCVG